MGKEIDGILQFIVREYPDVFRLMWGRGLYSEREMENVVFDWDEEEKQIAEEEKKWREKFPETQKSLAEFKKEIEAEYGDEVKEWRREFLEGSIEEKNKQIEKFIGEGRKTEPLWKKREGLVKRLYAISYGKMGGYSPEDIQEAESRPYSDFLKVDRRGFASCPFHIEKSPSFHVYKNKGRCFGCDWRGNVIRFVMQKENVKFPEAMKIILGK